jgi:hypothetical protein
LTLEGETMTYDYDRRTSSEVSLRKAIIRLAHAKPELRPHLLPLLKEANWKGNTQLFRQIKTKARAAGHDVQSVRQGFA